MTLLNHYPDAAKHVNDEGKIALHWACGAYLSNTAPLKVIQWLLEVYPEGVHCACDRDTLPIHYACSSNNPSLEVVKFLIDQYPDGLKTKDEHGRLPLHHAVFQASFLDIVQLLIESYPDSVKEKDKYSNLALHEACGSGASREVIELLMDSYNGEEAHARGLGVVNDDGEIPLHGAALETMQLLLEQYPEGTNVASSTCGLLPLHVAISDIDCDIQHIRLLVDSNPFSVLKTTTDGCTALYLASQREQVGRAEVVGFLLEKQNEVVCSIREAFDDVIDRQLSLPDLVVANIWGFVKPDLWEQDGEDALELEENELGSEEELQEEMRMSLFESQELAMMRMSLFDDLEADY